MADLTRGQNAPLPPTDVVIGVDSPAAVDLSALLVTAAGKVRSDADFIFFNQPNGPGVRLQDGRLHVSPSQIPPEIDAVRAVITLDDATSQFGRFAPPVARVLDTGGTELHTYTVSGLGTESVVIVLEVYNRNGQWKVRAVGQGYAGGFADLVTDHGVSVDDAPAAPAPAAPAAPAAAPQYSAPAAPQYSPPPAAPAAPQYAPPASTPQYSPPSDPQQYPAPTGTPQYPAPTGTPQYSPPSTPQQYPAPTSAPQQYAPPAAQQYAPPAAQQYSPPTPGQQYPAPGQQYSAPGYPAATPAAAPAPAASGGEISLSKDRPVSLVKGQKVSLKKDGGVRLSRVQMGLGWDPVVVAKRGGMFGGGGSRPSAIDLDASVLLFSGGTCMEIVYYGHLKSDDQSIIHSGDNLTGDGDGDDEVVYVDLDRIPSHIDNLVFVVTSYRGQTFQEVQNAYCRLIDQSNGAELARYTLAGGMPFTGVTMCVVHREGGEWKLRAIGEGFNGKTAKKAIPFVGPFLG